MPGTLYLVATPIGNLQDITLRALETLRTVDLIACEDTRHTRNLLNHFRISNKTVSYHEHNAEAARPKIMAALDAGQAVALEINEGAVKSLLCLKLDLDMDLARENIRPRYQYNLGKVKYGDIETDAGFLFARIADGQVAYSATTMTKILYRDQVLMEALPNTFGLQLDGAPPRTGYAKWRKWEDVVKMR